MARLPKGMDREDIKAAIRKSGWTLERLSSHWGYCSNAISVTLSRPWPAVEERIARFIGKQPRQIWPDRYHQDGTPKGRRTGNYRISAVPARNVQVLEAA